MLYERALHLGKTLRFEIPTPLLKLPRFTFNRCRFRTTELLVHRYARGSHIDVACTSVCDRDQNVHQAINVLFRSQSRDQAIQSLRREWSSDQGWFSLIKILDPGRKHFYRCCIMWLPLLCKLSVSKSCLQLVYSRNLRMSGSLLWHSLDPNPSGHTRKGLGKNFVWKCLAGMPQFLNSASFLFRSSTR